MDALRWRMGSDGMVVPGLVRQLRDALGDAEEHLHVGATSQDAIDTAPMLRLGLPLASYERRIDALIARLYVVGAEYDDRPIMAVTRMRDALPIHVSGRIAVWSRGLAGARAELAECRVRDLVVQLGSLVVTLDALGAAGLRLRTALAERLGLGDPGCGWHTDRSRLARTAAGLSRTTGAIAKIGADLVHMAQDGVATAKLDGGGTSSMAHKVNPVDAELLVALSTFSGGS